MRDYVVFGAYWIVLTALGEWGAVVLGHHFYWYVASLQGTEGQNASTFILLCIVPIFVFVVLMLLFGLFRFRGRAGDLTPSATQAKTGKLYISLWVLLSLFVNLFLFVHPTASAAQTYFQEGTATQKNSNALIIDVTALQWQWIYDYPQYNITAVDENGNSMLVLPVNRPVEFVIRSYPKNHFYDQQTDVIHSFWIPAFGIKTDAVPGETRYEYITPTQVTSTSANDMVRVQCAEVCGPGHPYMETPVQVVTSAQFDTWLQQVKKLQDNAYSGD